MPGEVIAVDDLVFIRDVRSGSSDMIGTWTLIMTQDVNSPTNGKAPDHCQSSMFFGLAKSLGAHTRNIYIGLY